MVPLVAMTAMCPLFVARQVIVARDGRAALKWSREDYAAHAEELEARKAAAQ